MKKSLLFLFLFLLLPMMLSASCPNLTGTYLCQKNGNSLGEFTIEGALGEEQSYSMQMSGPLGDLIGDNKTLLANNELELASSSPVGTFITLNSCEKKALVTRLGINGFFFSERRIYAGAKNSLKIDLYTFDLESKKNSSLLSKIIGLEEWFYTSLGLRPDDFKKELYGRMMRGWKWYKWSSEKITLTCRAK